MTRISIRDSFSFKDRLRFGIYDPMKKFLDDKGYAIQFVPGEFTMSEEEFNNVGLFQEAMAGACKCIHFAESWAFEDLCEAIEEILMVLWSISYRDYLDFLCGKFDPFKSKEQFLLLCELGTLPEPAPVVKKIPVDLDYETTMLLTRLKWFPTPSNALRLAGKINKASMGRMRTVALQFADKHKTLRKEMQDSRDACIEGDEHWKALYMRESQLLHYWQESLEYLV